MSWSSSSAGTAGNSWVWKLRILGMASIFNDCLVQTTAFLSSVNFGVKLTPTFISSDWSQNRYSVLEGGHSVMNGSGTPSILMSHDNLASASSSPERVTLARFGPLGTIADTLRRYALATSLIVSYVSRSVHSNVLTVSCHIYLYLSFCGGGLSKMWGPPTARVFD